MAEFRDDHTDQREWSFGAGGTGPMPPEELMRYSIYAYDPACDGPLGHFQVIVEGLTYEDANAIVVAHNEQRRP